ncbi:MAG: phosphatase PAP2 family protein [Chitinophagaceae bacterium]|nr:phosphatase PAP2 family protein [Chitinophagaceae bacterium]
MKKKTLYAFALTTFTIFHVACQKEISVADKTTTSAVAGRNSNQGHLKQTKTFSSDVAIQWMNMQLRQMVAYTGVGNVAYARHYAYSGIALYEAVVPGMPAYQSIASQLNGLTGLPKTKPGAGYHWAASANAALAYMNKKLFPNASADNKAAMDHLEATLLAQYSNEADAAMIERSVAFGKAVAEAVFTWADTDKHNHVNDAFPKPDHPGFVKKGGIYWTAPSNPLPVHSLPYMGEVRRLVASSGEGASLPEPDYAALKEMTIDVINAKPAPGTNEFNMVFWWRDFPGTSTPGHYVSILRQVLQKEQPSLDVAALAYSLGGIIVMDITITTWQDKFKYLLARPFNYKNEIGAPYNAATLLLSAPHPEYPAAHASLSMANAEAMTHILGDNYAFTDSTFYIYEALPNPVANKQPPRSFTSFREAGEEAGWSRLYGGIHYRKSITDGFWQGRKVAQNIITNLKFKKD